MMHRRRGRPRSARQGADLGTPELIHKRAHRVTQESLDLCLSRGLVTADQHWCGIHLRWLYTLRYGAPEGVRAVDPIHFGGREIKRDDPEWRAEREEEYRMAVSALQAVGKLTPVFRICVFNQRPSILTAPMKAAERDITALLEGLDVLVKLWISSRF